MKNNHYSLKNTFFCFARITMLNNRTITIVKSILLSLVFAGILVIISKLNAFIPQKFERFSYGILGTFVAFLVTWAFLRFDTRSFAAIGLKWEKGTLTRFIAGIGIGIMLAAIMIASLVFFSNLEIKLNEQYNIAGFLIWTLALVPLAFMEELAFRAYPFSALRKATGIWVTQIIIAVLFALYHVAGGQSLASAFLGPGVWSFVFGLAVIMSGGIGVATGLHYGANLVLAALGQQRGFDSIWTIQPGSATSSNIENIGNGIQIALLVLTILVMEWWIRKNKQAQ